MLLNVKELDQVEMVTRTYLLTNFSRLWHRAEVGSLDSILKHGLLSTSSQLHRERDLLKTDGVPQQRIKRVVGRAW